MKKVKIKDDLIKLNVWDLSGDKRFERVIQSYFRGIYGLMMVFDVGLKDSFEELPEMLKGVYDYNPKVKVVIVGCKCDKAERQVSFEEGM